MRRTGVLIACFAAFVVTQSAHGAFGPSFWDNSERANLVVNLTNCERYVFNYPEISAGESQ